MEILKTNILSIAVSGLLMTLTGMALYYFRDSISPYMRYLLPIPPIAVASYVFVFNMFRKYDGKMPDSTWEFVQEVGTATIFSTIIFASFTVLLAILITVFKKVL